MPSTRNPENARDDFDSQILDFFREQPSSPPKSPTESHFLEVFEGARLGARPPVLAALEGGRLSDRLAWVFVSGYQAVVRSVFPETSARGWVAFAATEDIKNPELNPPTELSTVEGKSATVSGCKSWVAQSQSVTQLVITVGGRKGRCFLVQVRDDELNPNLGVSITHRPALKDDGTRRFLAHMSQGFARFDQTPLQQELGSARIRAFVRREPVFVMLSSLAFMAHHLDAEERNRCADLAVELASQKTETYSDQEDLDSQVPDIQELARIDREVQSVVSSWSEKEEARSLPDFETDRMLLSLYSRGIQKRA